MEHICWTSYATSGLFIKKKKKKKGEMGKVYICCLDRGSTFCHEMEFGSKGIYFLFKSLIVCLFV